MSTIEKKSWLENPLIVRNFLLVVVVLGTLLLGGGVLMYGIMFGNLKFTGSIDGGVLIGAVIIGAATASARFLFGNTDSNGKTVETTTITEKLPPE